jgi:hypothetical protein
MRTNFDFSPLFRSSIGFDRMIDLLESASRVDAADNFPPYDIAKLARTTIASAWRWRVSGKTRSTSPLNATC